MIDSTPIVIEESYDGFVIKVNNTRFIFNQDDNKEALVKMFKYLGFTNVTYEEVY